MQRDTLVPMVPLREGCRYFHLPLQQYFPGCSVQSVVGMGQQGSSAHTSASKRHPLIYVVIGENSHALVQFESFQFLSSGATLMELVELCGCCRAAAEVGVWPAQCSAMACVHLCTSVYTGTLTHLLCPPKRGHCPQFTLGEQRL